MAQLLTDARPAPAETGRWATVPRSSLVIYPIVVGLWLAFGVTLLIDSGRVDALWDRLRDWPLVVEGVVWLLFLPWVVAIWVWQSGWPLVARLAVDAGLAVATLFAFLPRRSSAGR
jgi:hypothetical protein